jgi:hypothetical protein
MANLGSIAENVKRLSEFMYHPRLEQVPQEQANDRDPFWSNLFFSADDARSAYGMAACFRPGHIVEIGSGNSTKFFRKAISDHQLSSRLTSIDPAPRAEIQHIADEVRLESCLDAPMAVFEGLRPNDILFVDGSHIVFNGTDVPHIFLNILPILKPGVFVHFHDIALPNEYPASFDGRGYGEQYVLGALLLTSQEWKLFLPIKFAKDRGLIRYGGVSLWMTKV